MVTCANCHTTIDKQPHTYSIEKLREIKRLHEEEVLRKTEKAVISVGFAELKIIMSFLCSNSYSFDESLTVIPPKDKIQKNALSARTEQKIVMGMTRVRQVGEYINKQIAIDPYFSEQLKAGFVKEYERLKNEESLSGDVLFDSLLDFSAGHSSDFIQRAAGLTVLVYLFEKCEVFEK
jgi:hypothetical protein